MVCTSASAGTARNFSSKLAVSTTGHSTSAVTSSSRSSSRSATPPKAAAAASASALILALRAIKSAITMPRSCRICGYWLALSMVNSLSPMKRWPRMARAESIPRMWAGTSSPSSSRVTVKTGRTNWMVLSPQRIILGMGSLASAWLTSSPNNSLAGRPSTLAVWTSHSPLSVTRRSACSTVMPLPRAQPSAALVGLPSASNAWATAGPRFSTLLLGCSPASSLTFSARRRGEANHSTSPKARSALVSSALKLSAKASARERRALGGSSAVPISTRNVCCAMSVP